MVRCEGSQWCLGEKVVGGKAGCGDSLSVGNVLAGWGGSVLTAGVGTCGQLGKAVCIGLGVLSGWKVAGSRALN